MTRPFSRRRLLVAGGALGVAGCQPPAGSGRVQASATVAGYSGKLKGVEAILENLPSLLTARAPEGWQWLENRPATVGLLHSAVSTRSAARVVPPADRGAIAWAGRRTCRAWQWPEHHCDPARRRLRVIDHGGVDFELA